MSVEKLRDNIYWVGVKNPELRVFDIIMETKKGTTYNAYLIEDEKIVVIDSVKTGYYEEYINNIRSIIGNRKIDYIVVQHTELDHTGTLANLLLDYPEAIVVGSRAAIMYCKQIVNTKFNYIDTLETLCIGRTTLQFISTPNLHWPDTIFTYVKEKELLFTCDFLGCHYSALNCINDECISDYFDEMQYYFDVIMSPFKRFVLSALEKIKDLKFSIVAPSHGPIHISDIDKYLKLYKEWATIQEQKEKSVKIFYISAYGNTEIMAKYIENKIIEHGILAKAYEITATPMEDLVKMVESSKGIMIGSPTINQDAVKPAWDLLSLVCPITNRGKAAAAFGSYGWSGEGVPMLTERLSSLKFKVLKNGLKFNFVPTVEDFEKADELVINFIELL